MYTKENTRSKDDKRKKNYSTVLIKNKVFLGQDSKAQTINDTRGLASMRTNQRMNIIESRTEMMWTIQCIHTYTIGCRCKTEFNKFALVYVVFIIMEMMIRSTNVIYWITRPIIRQNTESVFKWFTTISKLKKRRRKSTTFLFRLKWCDWNTRGITKDTIVIRVLLRQAVCYGGKRENICVS